MIGKKRAGVGWAIVVFICILFAFGVIWDVLYYGGILMTYTDIGTWYGYSAYNATDLSFVMAFVGWWPLIVTLCSLYWLWHQANKPEGF